MDPPPLNHETVFRSTNRRACFEARLVLESAGISVETVQHDQWCLLVHESQRDAAVAELEQYQQENESTVAPARTLRLHDGAAMAVMGYAFVIALVYFLSSISAFGFAWRESGRVEAGKVIGGQLHRAVTALTLHADVEHIGSNLVFGALFGFLTCRLLGGGFAWLVILIAGAVGNLVNSAVQDSSHTSIGASTAVFSALGVLVAHALRPNELKQGNLLRRWSPLIAGIVLLGFTGVGGERTDVGAHIAGFVCGVIVGWLVAFVASDRFTTKKSQIASGIAACLIVAGSWCVALIVG